MSHFDAPSLVMLEKLLRSRLTRLTVLSFVISMLHKATSIKENIGGRAGQPKLNKGVRLVKIEKKVG